MKNFCSRSNIFAPILLKSLGPMATVLILHLIFKLLPQGQAGSPNFSRLGSFPLPRNGCLQAGDLKS